MPRVSVIIPTYNRAHIVGEAIESVLAQTYQDFESAAPRHLSPWRKPRAWRGTCRV